MRSKELIIEMLNYDIEKYQHYNKLYENEKNISEKLLQWNNLNCVSSSLNARKQMCVAFGYDVIYDENSGKAIDIIPR